MGLSSVLNAFKIEDLRKKILFTIFIIVLVRLGSVIPVPFMNAETLAQMFDATNPAGKSLFEFMNLFSGGGLSKASLFALSISPYISASIIIQLLTIAIPRLERMQKEEGEEGRRKINFITRLSTVLLAVIEAIGYYFVLKRGNALLRSDWFAMTVIVILFTAGACIVMWMGEKINEKGIGNGISLILFAGIAAQFPLFIYQIFAISSASVFWGAVIIVIFVFMVGFIVALNEGERRIPVQYSKKVVGRKMYGGQNTHLPLKVTMSGVLPIIFASAFVSMPSMIAEFFPGSGFYNVVSKYLGSTSIIYAVIYFLLIIAFNYFYVSVQYNPVEIANNIQKNGGFVFGIRPGAPTADYIKKVLNKITLVGALCLAVIAILPIIYQMFTGTPVAMGGTSILIIVGVILETKKQLESQMLMRHYKGFLE